MTAGNRIGRGNSDLSRFTIVELLNTVCIDGQQAGTGQAVVTADARESEQATRIVQRALFDQGTGDEQRAGVVEPAAATDIQAAAEINGHGGGHCNVQMLPGWMFTESPALIVVPG